MLHGQFGFGRGLCTTDGNRVVSPPVAVRGQSLGPQCEQNRPCYRRSRCVSARARFELNGYPTRFRRAQDGRRHDRSRRSATRARSYSQRFPLCIVDAGTIGTGQQHMATRRHGLHHSSFRRTLTASPPETFRLCFYTSQPRGCIVRRGALGRHRWDVCT